MKLAKYAQIAKREGCCSLLNVAGDGVNIWVKHREAEGIDSAWSNYISVWEQAATKIVCRRPYGALFILCKCNKKRM